MKEPNKAEALVAGKELIETTAAFVVPWFPK